MILELGVTDRGAKSTNFYVLRWSNMPAILIEGGFMSSPLDTSRLKNPVFRWRLARAVSRGIARFLAEDPFKPAYPRVVGHRPVRDGREALGAGVAGRRADGAARVGCELARLARRGAAVAQARRAPAALGPRDAVRTRARRDRAPQAVAGRSSSEASPP